MRSRLTFFAVGIMLLVAFLPAARSLQPQKRSQATDCADDTWTPTSTANAPAGRQQHTAIWTGSEMIIWGGYGFSNTGGRYNPTADSWTPTSTTNPPSDRYRHTAIWTGSKMIVWGGDNGFGGGLNTGGRYNPGTDSWINTSTVKAPDGRQDHTAVWTGSEMIVWGGDFYDGTNHWLNTGGRYNPDTDSWLATNVTDPPVARTNHTAVWTGTEMIIWGGEDGGIILDTGARYNPKTDTWTASSSTNAPAARANHTAVWTGTEMIVWGGFGFGGSNLNTGARYNPSTDTWTAINTTNAPVGRYVHTAVWTGSQMIVWGGYNGGTPLNSGGRYTLATDSWTATSIPNPSSARVAYTAVWADNEMIIWGGNGESGYLNTGGKYCARLAFSIAGTVTYCVRVVRPVPFVTLNLSGDMTDSATTDYAGTYTLSSVSERASYVVTPTPLRDLQPVTDPSPDTGDALKVQAHLQSGGTLLTGCAEVAAHTTGHATVDIGDALAIQRFVINAPRPPSNLTGQWRFLPASRSYADLTSDQSAQNYDAYVLGDVTGRVIFPKP